MQTKLLQEWKFHYGNQPGADYRGFDDSLWQAVTVPHDWSVAFPFSKEHSSGTGYLPGGTAWYRTKFLLPEKQGNKTVTITFDGVYKNSQVWCNGYNLGKRPSGYASFTYDITSFIDWDSPTNTIAVQVIHEDIADSRWFTGSGIYRKVAVQVQDSVYTPWDGLFFTTPTVTKKLATVSITNTVANDSSQDAAVTLVNRLLDPAGKQVLSLTKNCTIQTGERQEFTLEGRVDNPALWFVDTPHLYTLETTVTSTLADGSETTFAAPPTEVGIRWFAFDANTGFMLNGQSMKLKGVCLHHDAGALGAGVWPQVWQRRLETLKAGGCNAIRMAHNPHMKELYTLCDRMGFLAMDEAFDEWEGCKNKWSRGHNVYPPMHQGYSEDFPEWHERDLSDLVKRNRNHPSIIFWSIGNEIDYPNDPYCHPLFKEMTGNNDKDKPSQEMIYRPDKPNSERLAVVAKKLSAIVRQHDPTRLVLAACAFPELSTYIGYHDSFDVIGYNYKEHLYEQDHKRLPNIPIFGSENGHGWQEWKAVRDYDYIAGQFLWTGIDFLGETSGWPNHGSSAGIMTTAGYGKTAYYRRSAMWLENPTAYLATREHSEESAEPWTFARRWHYMPGKKIDVICYTNLPEAELFVNGVSLGMRPRGDKEYILWSLPFTQGSLSVSDGKGAPLDSVETALAPVQLLLSAWKPTTAYGWQGEYTLHQIEVTVADENGNRCTDDSSMLSVCIEGNGQLLGIENGDLSDTQEYALPRRRAYEGRGIVYVLSTQGQGDFTVSVQRNMDSPTVINFPAVETVGYSPKGAGN